MYVMQFMFLSKIGSIGPLDSAETIKKDNMGGIEGDEGLNLCRICLENGQVNDEELISPCLCSGTHKYVHQRCIKLWLKKTAFRQANENQQ